MDFFRVYNPVKLYFGKDVLEQMPKEIANFGEKALILYGRGSAKKNGSLDDVKEKLAQAGKKFTEFRGIKPNPSVKDVYRAIEVCKTENIDFIVAVGGGSVIDSAKVISVAYASNLDPWQIVLGNQIPNKNIPLVVVLTIAATGSEMNAAAVVQKEEENLKLGFVNDLMFPKVSFLNPQYTLTVPKDQTVNGIIDLCAHTLESYFTDDYAPLSDRFAAQVLLEAMDFAPKLLNDLQNYTLRARMMWAATAALNGMVWAGRKYSGDWGTHALAHNISVLYDTPHGQTLSIVFPAWMKHLKQKLNDKIIRLGQLLTNKPNISADETIQLIENFFKSIGAPVRLADIGLSDKHKNDILQVWKKNKPEGLVHKLNEDDYEAIIRLI